MEYGIDIHALANVYLRYRIVLHLLSKIFGLFGTTYVKRRVKIAIVFGEEIGDYWSAKADLDFELFLK